jgi:hypothetical protein
MLRASRSSTVPRLGAREESWVSLGGKVTSSRMPLAGSHTTTWAPFLFGEPSEERLACVPIGLPFDPQPEGLAVLAGGQSEGNQAVDLAEHRLG